MVAFEMVDDIVDDLIEVNDVLFELAELCLALLAFLLTLVILTFGIIWQKFGIAIYFVRFNDVIFFIFLVFFAHLLFCGYFFDFSCLLCKGF